ncbi:MAG: bifunctional transaldolase/phosoglucose isomerase [Elusimicrobia bacterium]|nr:bifunctional transaldolase/phosoglucose isomerase [Elusimicrobiota bacterium]
MSKNGPLRELARFGVSVWIDFISRELLESGALKRLIEADGVKGLTSNPTIFEKALSASHDYDDSIRRLAGSTPQPQALFEALAVEDIRAAADSLAGVFRETNGRDGFVSLELPPNLAQNAKASHSEALRLHKLVGRPNVMIKIPGTEAALPAITGTIADGVPVNVTLLFAQARYAQVVEAFLAGLERRAARGKDLSGAASVASFFVSRVDTAVDKELEKIAGRGGEAGRQAAALMGRAAVANAKLAYQLYQRVFSSERFLALKRKGARPQRLLWASTSAKNPAYQDTLYVAELIGADTVNTMPPATLDAFRDHGLCRPSLGEEVLEAAAVWKRLADLGVDLDAATRRLEAEGLSAFSKSYDSILATVSAKKAAVLAEDGQLEAALGELRRARFPRRLWAKDASLWKSEPGHQKIIRNSLGWLTLPDAMAAGLGPVRSFAAELKREGFERAVVLGMGGSSLSCEVFRGCFEPAAGWPALEVLDSTNPAAVAALERRIPLERTFFFVSSKSGSTIEPNCLMEYFFELARRRSGNGAGRQFAAITEPQTSLAKTAAARGFRKVFLNPTDVGGRFSALSLFGLVPAAVMGVDCERLLAGARAAARSCAQAADGSADPGLRLGAELGRLARQGRDKLTLCLHPALEPFGLWVEQLIAESTGKEGRGIVPVVAEPLEGPEAYGPDRVFAWLTLKESPRREEEAKLLALEKAGHPVLRFALADRYELAAQFFIWEAATAAAGFLLGVDPFDQPDVQSAKDQTKRLLGGLEAGELPKQTADLRAGGLAAYADPGLLARLGANRGLDLPLKRVLAEHLGRLQAGDYCAVLAYVHPDEEARLRLETLQRRLRRGVKNPVVVEYGPRYLHSTGQLHKGGKANGLFLQLVEPDAQTLAVPGQGFTFGTLHRAQARGDYAALLQGGRRILRLELGSPRQESLQAVVNAAEELAACPG